MIRTLAVVWLLPAFAAVGFVLLRRTRSARARRGARALVRFVLAAYVAGVIVITLWPLRFDPRHRGLEEGNRRPFHGTLGFVTSQDSEQQRIGDRDFVANVLLCFPLGLLLPLAIDRRGGVIATIVIAGALTLSLEVVQGAVVVERTFDIDDAISGFAGALAGATAAALVGPVVPRRRRDQ